MTKTKKSSQHELNLEDNQNNNLEEEYFEINLDTFLFNAGVIGFIEVLEEAKASKGESLEDRKDFYYEAQTLFVRKEFLLNADLSQMYIDTMIKKFADKTNISESIKKIDIILNDKDSNKDFKDDIKNIIDYFSAASIKTGLDTLIKSGISVNIQSNIEKIKEIIKEKNPNIEYVKNYLKEIKSDFENSKEVKDTLLMKNIMYTKINPFWENKAFLLPANSKKDIKEMFYKSFEEPLKELITNKKEFNYNCIVCNESINRDIDTTFLFEVGVDTSRKKSAFWNYNADSFICALCNYIYACTPLGFIDMSNLMLFVNQNDSIETLINMNEKIDFINNEDNKIYTVYNEIIRRILAEKTKELKSIQVIVRDKNHYLFNTIGKDSLQIIESRKKELKNISKIKSVKITDDYWIDVYKECLENIFNFRNQWNLIFKLLKIEDNKFILNTIFNILKIQIAKNTIFLNNKTLKEDNNMQKQFDLAYIAYKSGNEIRAKLIGANSSANLNSEQNKEADNKLRGLVYQLINYVHTSNRDLFLSNITRLYAGMNLSIPSIFLNIFKSDDEFKVIGNAYILGLKGSFYDDDSSKNNNDKKDN